MFVQTNHIVSQKDKEDAIELIKQAAAKLGIPDNLPIGGNNRQNMGQASTGFVQECIDAAKANPTIPSGEVDADLMQTKYNACRDFDAILKVLTPLAINTLNVRRLHGQDLMIASNGIMENFATAAKNRADMKPIAGQLKKRYARAKKDEAAAKKEEKTAAANTDAKNTGTGGSDVPA